MYVCGKTKRRKRTIKALAIDTLFKKEALSCRINSTLFFVNTKLLILKCCHDVLRLRADAVFSAPDANTAGDVVAGAAPLMTTPRTLVESIGNPADWPHLATVCMAAELEVNACLLSKLKVVGLMVEEDGVYVGVKSVKLRV